MEHFINLSVQCLAKVTPHSHLSANELCFSSCMSHPISIFILLLFFKLFKGLPIIKLGVMGAVQNCIGCFMFMCTQIGTLSHSC